jgi:hypothetical protein
LRGEKGGIEKSLGRDSFPTIGFFLLLVIFMKGGRDGKKTGIFMVDSCDSFNELFWGEDRFGLARSGHRADHLL